MGEPLIQLQNVTKNYYLADLKNTILNNISLQIDAGEMVAIVGVSGSGKSTLMNLIGLLDHIDEGKYYLQKRNVHGLSDDELAVLRNKYIGFVFQQFNLLPRFNALQNVILPLLYRDIPYETACEKGLHALSHVGLATLSAHKPTQLSGGQQQRVAIARALVGEPQVILADEPTGALDSATSQEIMNLFVNLHQAGRTVIIVTHDERIASQCSRRVTLVDGRIVSESLQ